MFALAVRLILLLLAIVPLRAQDEQPGIDEIIAARDASIAGFRAARKATSAECRTTYLRVLDAALKTSSDAATTAALHKERDGIADGLVAPADAIGLPADVAAARRVFFNGVGKASVDFDAAKKKLDADYLKTLSKLQAQSKRDKKLAAQIAAEKRRVAEGK